MDTPIVVVGAPRPDTTLLASMLARHSRIACGPETQVFNKLSPERLQAAFDDPAWPNRAVKLVLLLTPWRVKPSPGCSDTQDATCGTFWRRASPTRALLESLTALPARKRGKARWAEKTPNHLPHLPTLRRHYPDARVVRIVRDPRDSALSMRQPPWASRSALANAYTWSA